MRRRPDQTRPDQTRPDQTRPDQALPGMLAAMDTLAVSQAKAQLSAIIERVTAGETIAIGRRGRPEVLLTPFAKEAGPRPLGTYTGPLELADDFDDPVDGAVLLARPT